MGNQRVISVVIPVWNVAPWLEEALDSLEMESWKGEVEAVAVDDGSEDGSADILERYRKRYSCLRVIRQPNRGLSAARNAGMRASEAPYLYFFDSDDLLQPASLSFLLKMSAEHQPDLIRFSATEFSDGVEPERMPLSNGENSLIRTESGEGLFSRLIRQKRYASSVPFHLFRREFLRRENLWFEEGMLHEDEGFTPRAYLFAEKAMETPHSLYLRRVRRGSITRNRPSLKHLEGIASAIRQLLKVLAEHSFSVETERAVLSHLRVLYMNMVHHLSESGQEELPPSAITDLLSRNEIERLGLKARLYARSPSAYSYQLRFRRNIKKWTEGLLNG